MKKSEQPSSAEREESLKKKAAALGMPPEELAKLLILAEVMKAPSEFEQKKADDDRERTLQSLRDNAETENNRIRNQREFQKYCTHRKNDGKLAIGGQLIGPDGKRVAFVQCNNEYCKKTWMWTAMPEEVANGLCLNDDPVRPRFQSADQLDYQERQLPVDPNFCQKVGHPEVAERHKKYLVPQEA